MKLYGLVWFNKEIVGFSKICFDTGLDRVG